MPENLNNLAGGFLTGFANQKNQQRQLGMMDEYRKAQTEHIKLEAKKQENALKLQELEAPIYQMIAEAAKNQGRPAAAPQQIAPAQAQPFAQYQPQQQAPPQAVPDMIASGQTAKQFPFLQGPVTGLAPDLSMRLAAMGQDFFNQTGQPLKITDGFRTAAQQADAHRRKPFLALPAGRSQHEKGLAVDVDTAQVPLLEQTGLLDKYGFTRPALDSKNETWHLELGPQPQAQPQSTTPIQTAAPMQGGITGQRLLEGWLKKKYGVEPEEVKFQKMGSHLWVLDKKGAVMGVYPGQGEYKMTEVKRPDGSVVTTPILTPPSPIPPGVPVFSMPGGGGGMGPPSAMFGQGVQTAPPEITREEITLPGGAKAKIPVPKAQLGQDPIQVEPPKGANSSEAGRMQLAQSGLKAHQELENIIFDPNTGKSNWQVLAQSIGPGVPWTKGKQIKGLIMRSSDAIIRAATGAALNQQELEGYAEMYGPSVFDNEATIQSKMQGLRQFLNGYLQKMDPTEAARLRIGPIAGPMGKAGFDAPAPAPTSMIPPARAETAKEWMENGIKYRINPKTGKKQAWVE